MSKEHKGWRLLTRGVGSDLPDNRGDIKSTWTEGHRGLLLGLRRFHQTLDRTPSALQNLDAAAEALEAVQGYREALRLQEGESPDVYYDLIEVVEWYWRDRVIGRAPDVCFYYELQSELQSKLEAWTKCANVRRMMYRTLAASRRLPSERPKPKTVKMHPYVHPRGVAA